MTSLDVYLHEERVGILERMPQAKLGFSYEPAWVERGGPPISLSLPVREETYGDEACRPFFKGLLPEGDFLKAIARAIRVSAENSFTVLQEIGGECAGAISLAARDSNPPFLNKTEPRWLDEAGLGRLIENLPSPELLEDPGDDEEEGGFRLSLAGTQNKLPVLWADGRVGVTHGRPPSTHIVKKPAAELRAMVANEAYCLALAAAAALDTAEAAPLAAGLQEGLLVTRYDRQESSGEVRRVHQEDFCQALGILPEQKYQAEGGPGVAAAAELIRRQASAPAVDLLAFLDALIFNLLIGNTDAHGKNYSLLLDGDDGCRLAPLYDLLSARRYWPFKRKMAMKYGGEYRADRIRGRHLDRLAAELGVTSRTVRTHVQEVSEQVLLSTEAARELLPSPWGEDELLDEIDGFLGETAAALRRATAERD
jgi:serine/threonine-protein kinase HipA